MLMEKHCGKEECKNYWSCKMIFDRFKVKECEIGKQIIVNRWHLKELQDREVLLKGLSE
jgi:hypothetical protein